MSVSDFKFVSPGVFINEIDNSFVPKTADKIGPIIIGRSRRGLAMQPVKIESYSDFVEMFGDTVPGDAGGDVYRNAVDLQSPMYGTYAAKASLNANVGPVTYIRLLGQQSTYQDGTTAAKAGWKTDQLMDDGNAGGGAYGLFVAVSASSTVLGAHGGRYGLTGSNAMQLAAIWYNDDGGMVLRGTTYGDGNGDGVNARPVTASAATLITSDANGVFTVQISGATNPSTAEKITFNFDDNSENYIRKQFNTNPQLRTSGDFYTSTSEKDYWLGETFDQELRDASLTSGKLVGVILGLELARTSGTKGPANMLGLASREAIAGWFIGQDTGLASDFKAENAQKLFRLHGRGHGEWLQKNVKVSIERVRASNSTTNDYGTFSVVLRALPDTDNNVQVMERFDNLNLDPTSPNYIGKQIGTMYHTWDEGERSLISQGDYPNLSKFIRVELSSDVQAGASGVETLVPFGYLGPPKLRDVVVNVSGGLTVSETFASSSTDGNALTEPSYIIHNGVDGLSDTAPMLAAATVPLSWSGGGHTIANHNEGGSTISASLKFPSVRLRNSSSDGGIGSPRDAYFGMQTTRDADSTVTAQGIADVHRCWTDTMAVSDPQTGGIAGLSAFSYVFTLDDILSGSNSTNIFYRSGSHVAGVSITGHTGSTTTYKTLLNLGVSKFTAPFWGALDGLNIRLPDPLWNGGMTGSPTNEDNSIYYTWKRAIDTVADPEFVNMNLLAAPGLDRSALTAHMVNVCESRADALAVIDLEDGYVPRAEGSYTTYGGTPSSRVKNTPTQHANNLLARRIDSSYGCTFYPWVQTRDEATGQLLWVPPSVAVMGVLASSERASRVWFAPAGFNRGGLSDGAAGIPIINVTTRLTSKNRDTLYDARINPIASFPSTGIVIFGQKTLQERQSALDRINVRRLVIYLKKQISILSTKILFEQNVQATWNRFKGLIEPFLANVKVEFGITDYRLILDESTTTTDLIDQNILYAKIMIKPARAIEFIAIDFVIASTGASFDD